MDTKQIDNFLALYETRSIRRASESLYISQQGLSRSIRELERELGAPLFVRSTQGMTPNHAGDYFFEQIRPLRARLGEICRNVPLVLDDARRIEVPCAFGTLNLLYGQLKEFMNTTGTRVCWQENPDRAVEQKVLSGLYPLGISSRNPRETGLMFEPLEARRFVAMVPVDDELAFKEVLHYEDLRGRSIIIEGPQFNTYRFFIDRCLSCGFKPTIDVETTEISLCVRLASMGEGISIVPDFIAEQSAREGVITIPFADEEFVWECGLVWRLGAKPNGPFSELIDWLSKREIGNY